MPALARPDTELVTKVPAATLGFWLIKICATTVGETGGDALSMTLNLGYAIATLFFLTFFAVTLAIQIAARRYRAAIYWSVVVATTTVGTTTSDFIDRTLGLGYVASSIGLTLGVLVLLGAWRLTLGRISFDQITSRREEVFYWVTILVSNTLGTALGDFTADDLGLGFGGGALVFGALIAITAWAYAFTRIPRALLFWCAYVLTRPLGATVGDLLTKPMEHGGLGLGRFTSSGVILAVMIMLIGAAEIGRRKPGQSARAV